MKQTTFEEFVELTRRGTFVPVVKEIMADLLTPVSAFLKIAEHSDYAFLFESVEGGEQVARYSFLGKDPFLVLRSRRGKTTIERSGTTTATDEAFVPALRRLMAEFRSPFVPGLPRFTGGAVGFIGYDAAPEFEPALLRTWADRGLDGKDEDEDEAGFMLCDTVLAFDHVKHRILIVANARITPDEDLESLYQFACAKIQFLERELERSLSQPARETRPAPEFSANQTREEYEGGVRTIKEHIAAGDIYQAVLSQRFETRVSADPFTIYRALRHVNPSPYMYFMRMNGLAIVGSSPEMLVRVEGRRAETHPIAGTRPRGTNEDEDLRMAEELKRNEKERAEHVMLVDLGRNDLGRVCEFGSVRVPQYMALERYSHVMHLVSTVDGKLAEDRDHLDALVACFPAGHRVRRAEDQGDADPRRPRADPTRHLRRRGRLHRLRRQPGLLHRHPHHHDPERRRPRPGRRRHRRRLESGRGIPGNQGQGAGADAGARHGGSGPVILLLDNYDSFTFNLAQYLGELGAPPLVRRNDEITLDEVRALKPERIVISPGPGPAGGRRHFGGARSASSARRCRSSACASATRASGSPSAARWSAPRCRCTARSRRSSTTAPGIFKGVATPFVAGRYHSLVIADPRARRARGLRPRRGRHDHGACGIARCRCTACSSIPSRC